MDQHPVIQNRPISNNINDFFLNCVLIATFSNISAISWRPVLVVEEAGVPGENHRPWAFNWYKVYYLRLRVDCTLFVIYKAGHEPTSY